MKIKKTHLYGFVFLLLIIILGFLLSRFFPHPIETPVEESYMSESTTTSPGDTLPIMSTHKNVSNVTAFYTFVGSIDKLTETSISLKSDGTPLPAFTITDTTDYYELAPGQPEKIDRSVITPTSVVNLTANYNFENKQWVLNRITLVPPTTPTPTQ